MRSLRVGYQATGRCAPNEQVERQQAEAERAKQEARELRQYRKSLVFKVRGQHYTRFHLKTGRLRSTVCARWL